MSIKFFLLPSSLLSSISLSLPLSLPPLRVSSHNLCGKRGKGWCHVTASSERDSWDYLNISPNILATVSCYFVPFFDGCVCAFFLFYVVFMGWFLYFEGMLSFFYVGCTLLDFYFWCLLLFFMLGVFCRIFMFNVCCHFLCWMYVARFWFHVFGYFMLDLCCYILIFNICYHFYVVCIFLDFYF